MMEEVVDEVKEGIWGYLVSLDPKYGEKPLVLRKRDACPKSDINKATQQEEKHGRGGADSSALQQEEAYERTKTKGVASGGYLIGRHSECGMYTGIWSV